MSANRCFQSRQSVKFSICKKTLDFVLLMTVRFKCHIFLLYFHFLSCLWYLVASLMSVREIAQRKIKKCDYGMRNGTRDEILCLYFIFVSFAEFSSHLCLFVHARAWNFHCFPQVSERAIRKEVFMTFSAP